MQIIAFVCVGWPGSVHDARVLVNSTLYNEIECNHILPNRIVSISGIDVPLYMIGDSAYPLKKWLMKPFTHNTVLNEQQETTITGYAEQELFQKLLLEG